MKTKLLFVAVFFLMLVNGAKAQEFKSPLAPLSPESAQTLDSIHQYLWEKSTSSWTDYIFTYITRDTMGYITRSLERIYTGGTWMNYIQELFTYFNPAHPIFSSQTSQLWNTLTNNWETFAYSHANPQGLMDEQYNKQWNQATFKFISGYRDTMEYDQNFLSARIHQVYDTVSLGWLNSTMTSYTYDAMSRMTETLIQNWNDSAKVWINSMKTINTYDTSNYFVLAETLVWDNVAMSWLAVQRISYTDYFGGRPLHVITENWSIQTGQWYFVDKHSNAYMSNGSQSQDYYQVYDTATMQWLNSYLTNWTFYLTTLMQHERNGQFWNPNTPQWVLNAYDENDSLGRNIQSYYKSYSTLTYEIVAGSRVLSAYDTAGNRSNYKIQLLNVSNDTWFDYYQTIYTYDAQKNLIELLDQNYDTTATAWINNSKTDYYYSKISGIAEHKPAQRLCFYENPIHTGSTINCPNMVKGSNYDLKVYDLSGKMVFAKIFNGSDQVTFDKYLPEGLYIIRINENGRPAYTGKLVVSR